MLDLIVSVPDHCLSFYFYMNVIHKFCALHTHLKPIIRQPCELGMKVQRSYS